jgi:AbrB family looped-hinge helix DNA binding protein
MAAHEPVIEYLTTSKVGEKGQLTVPKEFRDDLGLGVGAPFAVLRLGDGLILLPEQQRFEHLCGRIGAALASVGVGPAELLATLPQSRERVYQRRYGSRQRRRRARTK